MTTPSYEVPSDMRDLAEKSVDQGSPCFRRLHDRSPEGRRSGRHERRLDDDQCQEPRQQGHGLCGK